MMSRLVRLRWMGTAAALMLTASAAPGQFLGPQPGSQSTAAAVIPPAMDKADTLILLPGDLCGVQVFDVPLFDYKARINDSGELTLPVVGTVHLGELSISEAEKVISARLVAAEYIIDPQVNLQVLESPNNFATVAGEVKTPGPVPIYGEKRLLDVLSAAGGLTPASSPLLTIYHRRSSQPLQIQMPSDPTAAGRYNVIILPGDNIVVAKVGVVYVIGAFHSQGAIPLKGTTPLTLIEAMSLAGGVNYEGSRDKAYILRNSTEGRKEIRFSISAVLKHKVPDQILQNDDIVLVPSNDLKAALKGGAAGVGAALIGGIGYLAVR
jgi:polysaccharide export outer membrane protein